MGRRRVRGIAFDTYGTLVDVAGARSFCFRVCWISQARAPLDPLGAKPDSVVSNLEELGTRLS